VVEFGEGEKVILLAARHHACESTGSYVLEGVIEELLRNPIPEHRVIAVPFVDFDGVVAGDQGKNRAPYDHARDYHEAPIYASVKAIQALRTQNVAYAFDFHSPWHLGGMNDVRFLVRTQMALMPEYQRFGELLEAETAKDSNALNHFTKDDLDPEVDWNTGAEQRPMMPNYFYWQNGAFGISLETPYFGLPDNVISQENMVAMGQAFARSVKEYLK